MHHLAVLKEWRQAMGVMSRFAKDSILQRMIRNGSSSDRHKKSDDELEDSPWSFAHCV